MTTEQQEKTALTPEQEEMARQYDANIEKLTARQIVLDHGQFFHSVEEYEAYHEAQGSNLGLAQGTATPDEAGLISEVERLESEVERLNGVVTTLQAAGQATTKNLISTKAQLETATAKNKGFESAIATQKQTIATQKAEIERLEKAVAGTAGATASQSQGA
jgi:chromosome segregation ATPase